MGGDNGRNFIKEQLSLSRFLGKEEKGKGKGTKGEIKSVTGGFAFSGSESLIASGFNVRGTSRKKARWILSHWGDASWPYPKPTNLDRKNSGHLKDIKAEISGLGVAENISFMSWSFLQSAPQTRKRIQKRVFWG